MKRQKPQRESEPMSAEGEAPPERDSEPAVEDEPEPEEMETYSGDQEDVWRSIYGHNGAKTITSAALRNGDVHVLLEGPPGSGKSMFLLALESNVPGTVYRDGDQITASKLRDVLKDDPPILLIDEIDALDNDAYDVLSLPMEHGRLVRDSARESYDIEVGTQVFGACNHADELPEHIANRFRILEFEKYDDEEFLELCEGMLQDEVEWITDRKMSRSIAEKIYEATGEADPRVTRDVATMATGPDDIDEIAMAMGDTDADLDAGPLYPSEIKRTQGEVGRYQLKRTLTQEMVQESNRMAEAAAEAESEGEAEGRTPRQGESATEAAEDVEAAAERAAEEAAAE